jgi:hypothetical protein
MVLVISLRIQGRQNEPLRNCENWSPPEEAIQEARAHFQNLIDCNIWPGISILERLNEIYLFTDVHSKDTSDNFQRFVLRLSERVCGDERLFHSMGHSRDLRMVSRKPAHVGFGVMASVSLSLMEACICFLPDWLCVSQNCQFTKSFVAGAKLSRSFLRTHEVRPWILTISTILPKACWGRKKFIMSHPLLKQVGPSLWVYGRKSNPSRWVVWHA